MEENQIHIPDGYISDDLGNLIKEKRKSSLKVSDAANYGEFPFFTSGEAVLEHTSKQLDGKNIFLATGGVANIKYYEGDAAFSTDTYAITTKEDVDTKYLYFDLLNILYYINANYFQGSGLKHLQKKDLKKHQILFPKNPKEQTQIATILSKVDEAIAQTEQLIAKYTRIKTGLMQDLLTKGIDENGNIRSKETHEFKDSPLGRIPREWECVNFGEYIELVHGYQFRNYDFTETGTQVVKIGQVKENGLDLSQCSLINPNRAQLFAKQTINNGDVLMALTGATLGKACIVSGLNNPVMQNYRVGRFEPFFINDVDKTFLFYTLKSSLFLGQIFNNVNEAAQGNVGKSDFKKSFFIKPPFEEQLKIVQHIEKIFNLVDDFNLELNKYQSLKTGLMQDLLSGKVRVNNIKTKEANETAPI